MDQHTSSSSYSPYIRTFRQNHSSSSSAGHHHQYSHQYSSSSTATGATRNFQHYSPESPLLEDNDDEHHQNDHPDSDVNSPDSESSGRGLGSRFRFSTHRLRSSFRSGKDSSARRVSRIFSQFKEQMTNLMPSPKLSPSASSSSSSFKTRGGHFNAIAKSRSSSIAVEEPGVMVVEAPTEGQRRRTSSSSSLFKRSGFPSFTSNRKKGCLISNSNEDHEEGAEADGDDEHEAERRRAREEIKNYWLRWQVDQYAVTEDFSASEKGQLTVKAGQKVEVLDRLALSEGHEMVAVALVDDESGIVTRQRGYIPQKILQALETNGWFEGVQTTGVK